jgi:hypothetical protein
MEIDHQNQLSCYVSSFYGWLCPLLTFIFFLIFLLQYYHITNIESQIYYIIQGCFLKEDPYYPVLAGFVKIS